MVCFFALYISRADNEVRILFVADPQLVGFQDEHPLFGYITRWDCDKYEYLTFLCLLDGENSVIHVILTLLLKG